MRSATKRILGIFLTLTLALGLLAVAPITASAAPPAAGTTWTFTTSSSNETNVAYGGGTYTWVQSSKTLLLNGVTHSTAAATALSLPDGTTLVLTGSNVVSSTFSGASATRGILANGALTITGSGSLIAAGGKVTSSGGNSDGIEATALTFSGGVVMTGGDTVATGSSRGVNASSVTLIDGATVAAMGYTRAFSSDITVPAGYEYSVSADRLLADPTNGISDGSFVVGGAYKAAKITPIDYTLCLASDGKLYKNSPSGEDVTSLMANAGAVVTGSAGAWVLTLTGFNFSTSTYTALRLSTSVTLTLVGTNTITSTYSGAGVFATGIYADSGINLTINGTGSLAAKGGNPTGQDSYGIVSMNGYLTISGSATVTATGGTGSSSTGIACNSSIITVNGNATVSATGGTATAGSFGLYNFYSDLTVNGGTVTATGGTAPVSYGICNDNAKLTVNGGTVTAAGGDRAIDPDYTVPNGYQCTVSVNKDGSSPATVVSNGGFTVTDMNKYAKIVAPTAVNLKAIAGVTAPATGATAVTAITETAQYTGTVTWSPALDGGKFAASTAYKATITLTPKAGYTLAGVAADYFTVAGATPVTNAANSGVISATFPATGGAGGTTYTLTVVGGTGNGNYAANAAVPISATVPSGKVFVNWTTSSGGSFANANSTSTTYTMPTGNATVTANFKDAPKMIFSTKYPSNFLNWLLFIVCFGWIWMWFI